MRHMSESLRHEPVEGHLGPVTSVAWSKSGSDIATSSYDGRVILWAANELAVKWVSRHPKLVNDVRWSIDGEYLAVSCADGNCYILDAQNGSTVQVLSRHRDDVNAAAWSPDGGSIVTVSEDGTGRIWSVDTGVLTDSVLAHSDHCMSVDWSAADGTIATCGDDATIRLWDCDGELLCALPQPGDLEIVRWSPSGDFFAVTCDDLMARVLDKKGVICQVLGPHDAAPKSLAWSPDGYLLAVGSYDCTVRIWDVRSGALVASYSEARIWPRSMDWSRLEEIAVGSQDGVPKLLRFDMSRRSLDSASSLSILTHGFNSVVARGSTVYVGSDDGLVRAWNPSTGDCARVAGNIACSLVNALDASENLLAYGTFGRTVSIVTPSGEQLSRISTDSPVNSVKWSMSGAKLAVAEYSGLVTFFGFEHGELVEIGRVRPSGAAIKSVDWIDDCSLVAGSTDRSIYVLDDRGTVVTQMRGHGNLVNSVSVRRLAGGSPLVASASRDRTVRVWDLSTQECVSVLVGHSESVKAVCWSPTDPCRLASGSYDFDVIVWELGAGSARIVDHLDGHGQGISSLSWGDVGLVSVSWDGQAIVWRSNYPHWHAEARLVNGPIG